MSEPHWENCPHSGSGWCLRCVWELGGEFHELQEWSKRQFREATGRDGMDAMLTSISKWKRRAEAWKEASRNLRWQLAESRQEAGRFVKSWYAVRKPGGFYLWWGACESSGMWKPRAWVMERSPDSWMWLSDEAKRKAEAIREAYPGSNCEIVEVNLTVSLP